MLTQMMAYSIELRVTTSLGITHNSYRINRKVEDVCQLIAKSILVQLPSQRDNLDVMQPSLFEKA